MRGRFGGPTRWQKKPPDPEKTKFIKGVVALNPEYFLTEHKLKDMWIRFKELRRSKIRLSLPYMGKNPK